VSNEAGTRGKKWHKIDTSSSPHVPPDQTENAVPAGPRNGADADEKTVVFQENAYHEAGSPASQAALWFAKNRDKCPHPIVPFLKHTFGISALDAVLAIQAAKAGDK
tara:strand:- start:15169 stop:15489 length:321 start_codon:yes stop_codon:yes gene_type:complete